MASYIAKLSVSNTEYTLSRINFFAVRDRDKKGRPVPDMAWTVMMSLYAIRDTFFTDWMLDPTKKRDAKISFYSGTDKEKEWELKDVYCVGFEENFVDDLGIMETLVILAGSTISNGNATLTYQWSS
ncbi:hypothetical protein GCM10028818_40040 [Spirosoma horti]